jgi:hypothetical protein
LSNLLKFMPTNFIFHFWDDFKRAAQKLH